MCQVGVPAVPHRLGSITIPEVIHTGAFAFGGNAIRVALLARGYVDHLIVRISGTVTVATGDPGLRPGAPWNGVRRFLLDGPDLRDSYDLDGFMAKVQGDLVGYPKTMLHPGGFPPIPRLTSTGVEMFSTALRPYSIEDSYPVAVAANAWDLRWRIDVKRNFRDHRGMFAVDANQESLLVIEPNTLAELVNTPANVTGTNLTIQVVQYMRTPPVGGVGAPDTSWRVKYAQQQLGVAEIAAGNNNDVRVQPEGILLNAISFVVLDDDVFPADPLASIESISHLVNEDKRKDAIPAWVFLDEQQARYPRGLPQGVFAFDGDADQADIPYLDGTFERFPGWIRVAEGRRAILRFRLAAAAALDNPRIVTSTKRLVRG